MPAAPSRSLRSYRKEATGGLDDVQLRTLEERLVYLRELQERRESILASIAEQGKLTAELKASIEAADTKQRLEDLYLPYKPKRRTKAQIAREAGLDVLADSLLANPALDPQQEAEKFIRPAFQTPDGENPRRATSRRPSRARATFSWRSLPRTRSSWARCARNCAPGR